jgi:flagellar assembly factor FliW
MIFELKSPLLGFENITKMELKKIDDVFARLQVVGAEEPSFTLINPFVLREYSFDIPDSTKELLGIDEHSNFLIFNMLIISNPLEDSRINFVGPLIFNTDNQSMIQLILADNSPYGVAEKLSDFLNKESE